jgi:hypothetical protein
MEVIEGKERGGTREAVELGDRDAALALRVTTRCRGLCHQAAPR